MMKGEFMRNKEIERHMGWIEQIIPEIRPGAVHMWIRVPYFQSLILQMMEDHVYIGKQEILSAMQDTYAFVGKSKERFDNVGFSFCDARKTIRILKKSISEANNGGKSV